MLNLLCGSLYMVVFLFFALGLSSFTMIQKGVLPTTELFCFFK